MLFRSLSNKERPTWFNYSFPPDPVYFDWVRNRQDLTDRLYRAAAEVAAKVGAR